MTHYSAPGAKYAPRLPAGIPMALRAVALAYPDPFTGRRVRIAAPRETFTNAFGFTPGTSAERPAARAHPGTAPE